MNKKDFFVNKLNNLYDCLNYLENNKFFYDIGFYNLYHLKLLEQIKSLESYIETL